MWTLDELSEELQHAHPHRQTLKICIALLEREIASVVSKRDAEPAPGLGTVRRLKAKGVAEPGSPKGAARPKSALAKKTLRTSASAPLSTAPKQRPKSAAAAAKVAKKTTEGPPTPADHQPQTPEIAVVYKTAGRAKKMSTAAERKNQLAEEARARRAALAEKNANRPLAFTARGGDLLARPLTSEGGSRSPKKSPHSEFFHKRSWKVKILMAMKLTTNQEDLKKRSEKRRALRKYSNMDELDAKVRQRLHDKADAIVESLERNAMRLNERNTLAVRYFHVASAQCFFVSLKCFIGVHIFLNHHRDYMVCAERHDHRAVYEPACFNEREIVDAHNTFAKTLNLQRRGSVPEVTGFLQPAAEPDEADLRRPPALPPFVESFLFRRGRLFLSEEEPDRLVVHDLDSYMIHDAVQSGRADYAAFGDYEAASLAQWQGTDADGALHAAFGAALDVTMDAFADGAKEHAEYKVLQEAIRHNAEDLRVRNEVDGAVLGLLERGYAPPQKSNPNRPGNVSLLIPPTDDAQHHHHHHTPYHGSPNHAGATPKHHGQRTPPPPTHAADDDQIRIPTAGK